MGWNIMPIPTQIHFNNYEESPSQKSQKAISI